MNSVAVFSVFIIYVFSVACSVYDTHQRIVNEGYTAETHQVTTSDGYILEMQRIPFRRGEASGEEGRPVVFLMHGLAGSSAHYIQLGRDTAIAYNLADAGYDVWLGNGRGNHHSRRHVTLNPDASADRAQFFDFSWHEVGYLDIPAMIDYVLEYTGSQKLYYVGNSQGGTTFLVMASTRPEYNDKLAAVHLLAAVGYQEYFPQPFLRLLSSFVSPLYGLAGSLGLVELFSPSALSSRSGNANAQTWEYCFGDLKYRDLCQLVGVRDALQYTNTSTDNVQVPMEVSGASTKQIAHYGQNINDKIFRQWDYGLVENIRQYGRSDPPVYNLSLITADVTMHYTVNDDVLDEKDVYAMATDMPNTKVRRVARETFEHNDFLASPDVRELVTVYIIDAIAEVHARITGEAVVEAVVEAPLPDGSSTIVFSFFIKIYLIIYSFYRVVFN